jgi:biopolymer transport protein ExbD
MPRSFRRQSRLAALSEINVTPLIDLAFALLIIFMITTPLLEQTIALQLPSEEQRDERAPREERYRNISIDAAGQLYWGKRPVTAQDLQTLLDGLAASAQPPVLHIRADGRIPYQQVIDVLDLIKQAGLSRISLDTAVD